MQTYLVDSSQQKKVTDRHGNIKYYNERGQLHRDNGPAVIAPHMGKFWFVNGMKHRVDGPAHEYDNGGYRWYFEEKLHRVGGPATYIGGNQSWYYHGKQHREDGPAVVYADGRVYWYLNGWQMTLNEYLAALEDTNLKIMLALQYSS